MQNPKTGGNRFNPDIRSSEIDTYTETNGEQTAEYKIVNTHPIIGGILNKLAFFRTHASAVWYNRLANKTVKQKFDDVDSEVRELNEKLGKKQDSSTAITTSNISNQSVNHAVTAGSANAVAWGNVSGKPSTYPPSTHTHDDRYYTESEINNFLGAKARIARTGWGTSLTIPNLPHGLVMYSNWQLYLIWAAGNAGSYAVDVSKVYGVNEDLSFTIDKNTGTVVVRLKSGTGAITYIGS